MNFYKGKKVLVTGGDGFIGSYLVEILRKDGAVVTIASDKNTDLRVPANCVEFCRGKDIVMNLAAKAAGIGYNKAHQDEMYEVNKLLQVNPLEAAAKCGVKRFLQVSSACVYPSDAEVPTPETEAGRAEPDPDTIGYARAKLAGEQLAKFYAHSIGMKAAIVRPFNGYGIRPHDPADSHVVPTLIKRVLDGNNPVEVWGSGNQERSFVHVRDLAMGMKLVTEKYAEADPVNIGHDRLTSMKELVKIIQDASGIHNPLKFLTDKPEGHAARAADPAKLKKVTGFVPSIPLEEGIREMVEAYRQGLGSRG